MPKTPELASGPRRRLVLVLLLVHLVLPAAPAAAAVPDHAASNAQRLLQYANAERAARGLGALARDPALDSTAQAWAARLASEARMYHSTSPGAGSGHNWRGENVAYWEGPPPLTAEKLHAMWMGSTVHRNNIVHPGYSHAGFGLACELHGGVPWVFAVVHFGGPDGPVQRSDPGQASGQGSTTGMTCGRPLPGQDSPPPAPVAAAPPDPPPAPPPASPAPAEKSAPTRSAARPAASPPAAASAPGNGPTGGSGAERAVPSPSLPGAAAPAGSDPSPAVALSGRSLGATQRSFGPVWLAAAAVLALLIVARSRRPRPRHSARRRAFRR